MIYQFADWELDTERYLLARAGQSVKLRRQVFHVLAYLLAQPGRVVSKQELAEQLWSGRVVSDTAVESCIRAVRRAIGDSGHEQRIIQTRYGQGYSLVVAVRGLSEPQTPEINERALHADRGALKDGVDTIASTVGEHKVVTILCCGLCDDPSPPDGVPLSLEVQHRRMQRLYDLAQHGIRRYDGYLQPLTGASLRLIFGYPTTQEDHARRAVLAALALCQQYAAPASIAPSPATSSELEAFVVSIGVATGLVATSGSAGQDGQPVVGDVVSDAQLLQSHAAPNTILCDKTTADLVRKDVRLGPPRHLTASTLAASRCAYPLIGNQSRRIVRGTPSLQSRSPFIGRAHDLAALEARWNQSCEGHGQVVGIVGEPGIGKTRFVSAFRQRRRRQPCAYVQGRCVSYGHNIPYYAILELVRHACGIGYQDRPLRIAAKLHHRLTTLGMPPEANTYLAWLFGDASAAAQLAALDPVARTARLFETFVQLAILGSQSSPVVLEIEDVHWMDTASCAVLEALIERLAALPILVLVTYRPGYRPPWIEKSYAMQIALSRLSAGDCETMLQAILPSHLATPSLRHALVAKANGNPFFLEALAHSVVEQDDPHALQNVPKTVQAVLMARVDRLPPSAKPVLQAMAVLGQDVPENLIKAMLQLDQASLEQNLRPLRAAEFLHETRHGLTPVYTFHHTLIQDTIYQSLLESTRRQYHQQAALALESQCPDLAQSQPEWLAHHYTAGGCDEQALPWWRRAGERAHQHGAYKEATHHLQNGLDVLNTLPDTPEHRQLAVEFYLMLGMALQYRDGAASADLEHVYRQALALCPPDRHLAQRSIALSGVRRMYMSQGKFTQAEQLGHQLLHIADKVQDPGIRQRAYYDLGQIFFHRGDLKQACTYFSDVATLADERNPMSVFFKLNGQGLMARAKWILGYPDQARRQAHETLARARDELHPSKYFRFLISAAWVHNECREGDIALALADDIIALTTEWHLPQWQAFGAVLRGRALIVQGCAHEGIAQLRQGESVYRAMGIDMSRPSILAMLAEGCLDTRQIEAGLQAVAEGLAIVENVGRQWWEAELYRLQGALLLAAGHTVEPVSRAEKALHHTLDIARRQRAKSWELRAARDLCQLWYKQGKRDAARDCLSQVYNTFAEGFDTADLQSAQRLLRVLA